jgi:Leucine-rich repeat (LRR) protein
MTCIPTEIGQLHQLQDLFLSNNQIAQMPAEMGQLQQLQELYVNNNQLTQI